jgi:hypothetical protein
MSGLQLLGAALLAVTASTAVSAGNVAAETFSRSMAFAARGRIALENNNGNVVIEAWDRGEVRIDAVKRAASPGGLDGARIEVESTGDRLSIRTCYDGGAAGDPAEVEYRILVPRNARLADVRLVNGHLSLSGLAGEVHAWAINGSIHAERLEGEAELSTVNGRLDAGFYRVREARAISLTSINGPITLSLPGDTRASLDARNLSGGIRTEFGDPARPEGAGGERLHTEIQGGGTRIHVHNVNGGISITGDPGGIS